MVCPRVLKRVNAQAAVPNLSEGFRNRYLFAPLILHNDGAEKTGFLVSGVHVNVLFLAFGSFINDWFKPF